MAPKLHWWQRGWSVATIGVACLLVGVGIGGASSSSSTKSKPLAPTPAQLAAQAEATKARMHREEAEKAANERARVANEKKEAREKAAEAQAATRKAREEAAQKHREEQQEKQAAAEKLANETKVFTGSATENLGTVNVETESVLTWTCEGCGESNFIINASSGPSGVLVNSLKETSGHTVVDEGTYKDFQVTGEGPWTVKISPNG
jgi:flagellar biosynthesis GTPase FlhF